MGYPSQDSMGVSSHCKREKHSEYTCYTVGGMSLAQEDFVVQYKIS